LKKFGGDKFKDPEKNKETNNAIKKAFKQMFKIFMKYEYLSSRNFCIFVLILYQEPKILGVRIGWEGSHGLDS
jgi:glutathione peroxidase-family protein